PVLRQLLEELSEEVMPDEGEVRERRTGRRLAEQQHIPPGDLRARLQTAVNVLNGLGGLAELEQRNGAFYIQGYSCPLAAVAPGHPEVCHLSEALLSELVGLPVKECCDGNEPARCCFSLQKS